MTNRNKFAGFLLSMSLSLAAGQALAAAQPVVVNVDQSQIVTLPRQAGTVVIGNPSIADASIQGLMLFIHGRGFGTTNLIVLDDQGAQMANYQLTVQLGGDYNVTTFKAGLEYSYVCAPDCEAQMHVGDEKDWFKQVVLERNKDKIGLATGQKSAEANQPPPAQ